MFGRKQRAEKIQNAMGRPPEGQPKREYDASDEKTHTWGNFYSSPDKKAYAEKVLSYTALREAHERPVRDWRRDMEAEILPWVEHNAPGGEQDALLALELPESNDGTVSGGAFVRWDTDGTTKMYSYALEKGGQDPETGAQQLSATIIEELEVNKRAEFPAPQGAKMFMSVRGRAHQYDGREIAETDARQSYQRSFTSALREAVTAYEKARDPQLPAGTDRYVDNMGGLEQRTMLAKRYSMDGARKENVFEVVTSRMVADKKGEYISYGDIENDVLDMARLRVEKEAPGSDKMGDYLVEHPRTQADTAAAGYVVVREDGMARQYELQIAADGAVSVAGGEEIHYRPDEGDGLGQLPRGARITTSVRGFLPAGDRPYGSDAMPEGGWTDEESRLRRVRAAVSEFDARQQ